MNLPKKLEDLQKIVFFIQRQELLDISLEGYQNLGAFDLINQSIEKEGYSEEELKSFYQLAKHWWN